MALHKLLVVGEVHHRPLYWSLDSGLVRAVEFPKLAGVIYLELPSNDQTLVDEFLAAPEYAPKPVIDLLRDNLWMGWPDQPMLDFFKTVWEVNLPLPAERRLRIVLVDMERPWKLIRTREDLRKYDVGRNQYMAANIARDLERHSADARNALFIVGWMHATRHLTEAGGGAIESAAWHLGRSLGETNVFAVFPHCPIMANMGGAKGRLAQGLFDSAFAALSNRPVALPLDHGPFGQARFDASLDFVTTNSYAAGFDAYLYLGPLEEERFSPLIPQFYTDDFVQELDRRHRLESGPGLVEAYGLPKLDAESLVHWMSATWGQPRREWSRFQLGPVDAWRHATNDDALLAQTANDDNPAPIPEGSVPKPSWAFVGQATPEASLQSMLWAASHGDFDKFTQCCPPDNPPTAGDLSQVKAKTAPISAFRVEARETNSVGNVILKVVLYVDNNMAAKADFIMKAAGNRWHCVGKAD